MVTEAGGRDQVESVFNRQFHFRETERAQEMDGGMAAQQRMVLRPLHGTPESVYTGKTVS